MPPDQEPDLRFLLAAERTLLAWIRTGIGLQAGGLAVLHLVPDLTGHGVLGVGLMVVGALSLLVGAWRYRGADRAIRRGAPPPSGTAPLVVLLLVFVLAGGLAAAAVATEWGGR